MIDLRNFCIYLLPVCLLFGNPAYASEDIRNAVVQVFNDRININYRFPWQQSSIDYIAGSGVIIDKQRILTNAHVIKNSRSLLVRRVGSDKNFEARVEFISEERDLALLTVPSPGFFNNSLALDIGELPQIGSSVVTYGFPEGGSQLAITSGIISRIDYDIYAHSGYRNLVCQIDAAINTGASGGPAIVEGRIAGLSFQMDTEGDNIGYVIPAPVIKSFLRDIEDGKVDGVPQIAVNTVAMHNYQMRDRYGLADDQSGVLISELSGPEEELGLFRPWDILLAIDGKRIGNDNTVHSPQGDRVHSDFLISAKQIGDDVAIEVLRGGQIITFDYPLRYAQKEALIIPGHSTNHAPDFMVIGGLVIIEVSEDVLSYWDWRPSYIRIYDDVYKHTGVEVAERLLLITAILPDEINQSYSEFDGMLLSSVNDNPVFNLRHLRDSVASLKVPYLELGIDNDKYRIVFKRDDLQARNAVIRKEYKITNEE